MRGEPDATRLTSQGVYPGPDGKLVYQRAECGDRVRDFSHGRYQGGGATLPTVSVQQTVRPSDGPDDDAAIPAASDEVAALPRTDGFRGAVLLALELTRACRRSPSRPTVSS